MKKLLIGLLLAAMLSGCGVEPVYETIGDVWGQAEPAVSPGRMRVLLPEGAEMEVMDGNGDSFYRVGDWDLWTRVLSGGDINKTLETLSGLDAGCLTVIDHKLGDYQCHETTWSATAEEGTQVIRAGILDDGSYHYCLCVSVPQEDATQVDELFEQVLEGTSIIHTAP